MSEFLGTFLFVFLASVLVVVSKIYDLDAISMPVGIASIYTALIFATLHLSGGFLNPAITVSLWIAKKLTTSKAIFFIISGVFLVPLIPLFYFLSKDTAILKTWLGLPEGLATKNVFDNLINLPNQILLRGVDNPLMWVYNTPIIDAVTLVLIITGFIYIFNRERYAILKKSAFLFLTIIIGLILLNGYDYISLGLPLLYMFAAVGLTFLVEQWFHIFPRNPLARSIGMTLVVFLVGLVSSYHVTRYFIAWPRMDATRDAYSTSQSVTINKENKE